MKYEHTLVSTSFIDLQTPLICIEAADRTMSGLDKIFEKAVADRVIPGVVLHATNRDGTYPRARHVP